MGLDGKDDGNEDAEDSSGLDLDPQTTTTISCLLCGGAHIYPRPRYEKHLMNEHGVIFDVGFIVELTLFKQTQGSLPKLQQGIIYLLF